MVGGNLWCDCTFASHVWWLLVAGRLLLSGDLKLREDPNRFKSARKIAVFFLLAALASQAHADCLQIITHTENVRVRESANLNSRVIGKLEKNVAVSAVPFGKDWFEIAGGDYPGAFVSGQYVVFT
ncbi:MAG: SH3 domain-containing protein, partial [Proteobacteria bacterium]